MSRWYKRNGADFIHGTMGLTLEQKGAYSICLDLIYDRGAPIPDDERWLSGVCGVSIRKWKALRDSLVEAGKLYIENGTIGNVRADFEMVSSEKYHRNQAESGAKGGRKRAENAANTNENNNLAQASLKPNREDKIRIDTDVNTSVSARANSPPKFEVPDWVPPEAWNGWLEMRKAKRAGNTEHALKIAIAKLDRLRRSGHDPGAVLDQSTLNNYTGIFPLKASENGTNYRSNPSGNNAPRDPLRRALDTELAGDGRH